MKNLLQHWQQQKTDIAGDPTEQVTVVSSKSVPKVFNDQQVTLQAADEDRKIGSI